jgi:hypothetical protein
MNRRTIGRGRVVAGIGAILTLVGCFLPWVTGGGDGGLPAISKNAFENGIGILVFLAAIGILALIALPYAAGDRRLGIDRPAAFVLLVSIGIAGFATRAIQLVGLEALGLPDRALGFWLSALGLVVMAWGAAEVVGERRTD